MTTEEKLKHFQETCTQDAKEESDRQVEEHKKALEAAFKEHADHTKSQAEMQLAAETEKLERELNKTRAAKELDMKREINRCQEEYKDKLFGELQEKITAYMQTDEYLDLLQKQVDSAVSFANGDELQIYLDPSDADKASKVNVKDGVTLTVSDSSFGGGIKAVMPGRNILIDQSFETKIREARRDFKFDLGGN